VVTALEAGDYLVSAALAGYLFSPPARPVSLRQDTNGFDFSAQGIYSISGWVTNQAGAPVAGVPLLAGSRLAMTDSAGVYAFTNLPPGAYLLTPFLTRNLFTPETAEVVVSNASVSQSFLITPVFNLSGRVTQADGSNGLPGVIVVAMQNGEPSGQPALTDADGSFTLISVHGGTNAIVLDLPTYVFNPANFITNVAANLSGLVFVGTQPRFQIQGRLLEGAAGLAGLTVYFGASPLTTDSAGRFSITNLFVGTYTVAPKAVGPGFEPAGATNFSLISNTNLEFQILPFRLATARTNQQLSLTLLGVPGRSYAIESRRDLAGATNWVPLGNRLAGANGSVVLTNMVLTNADLPRALLFRAQQP
jgi:hypothetical protein